MAPAQERASHQILSRASMLAQFPHRRHTPTQPAHDKVPGLRWRVQGILHQVFARHPVVHRASTPPSWRASEPPSTRKVFRTACALSHQAPDAASHHLAHRLVHRAALRVCRMAACRPPARCRRQGLRHQALQRRQCLRCHSAASGVGRCHPVAGPLRYQVVGMGRQAARWRRMGAWPLQEVVAHYRLQHRY